MRTAEITFTAEESARIQELRDSGGIRAAVMVGTDNYFVHEDGKITGLDYLLMKYYSDKLDIPLIIDAQPDFSGFFSNNGVFNPAVESDENIIYTPDLLKTNDIYILPLTITGWRERLVQMVSMYPAGIGLYGAGLGDIADFDQIDGMTVTVIKDTYLDQLLSNLEEMHKISLNRLYLSSNEMALPFLLDGRADFTIDGFRQAVQDITAEPKLSLSPLPIQRVIVGWAVKKEDILLKSVIVKLFDQSLTDGTFQRMYYENFDVDFEIYLDILSK